MGKRGFRNVPDTVRSAIADIGTGAFRVAASRPLTADVLETLAPLGIALEQDGSVTAPDAVVPDASQGRWSRWNLYGRLVARRDLPKVTQDFGWEAPNFGDASRGTHWVSQQREVYQKELWYGQQVPLLITVHGRLDEGGKIVFIADYVFDAADYNERDLIFVLSLMQENVRSVSVIPETISVQDWADQQHIHWEFLPVGSWDRDFSKVLMRLRVERHSHAGQVVEERLRTMYSLQPGSVLVGSSGFERYLGFKFRDDLVVFENVRVGNAAYIMYGDWQILSKRSRTELFNLTDARYDRVIHRDGWQQRLQSYLRAAGHQ